MLYLYANVSLTALFAVGIEDFDFAEIATQLFTSLLPAAPGALPLGGISDLFVQCVSTGAANAFLTLRVGEVARQYCETLTQPNPGLIRRSATIAALAHVRRIVFENSAAVMAGFTAVTKGVGKSLWHRVWRGAAPAGEPPAATNV